MRYRRLPGALGCSLTLHAAALAVVAIAFGARGPASESGQAPSALSPARQFETHIVWLSSPGPGGGDGGGGNRSPEPPRRAESPGRDIVSLPIVRPRALAFVQAETPPDLPQREMQVILAAKPLASGARFVTGLPETTSTSLTSQGPGQGGGVGEGNGPGLGPGVGPGLGPGTGSGTGGEGPGYGAGIEDARLLERVDPMYTARAMERRVEGSVILQGVVLPDGTVGELRIVRSLDPVFGLDEEAMRAARRWRFIPARRAGRPVAQWVSIEMEFRLR